MHNSTTQEPASRTSKAIVVYSKNSRSPAPSSRSECGWCQQRPNVIKMNDGRSPFVQDISYAARPWSIGKCESRGDPTDRRMIDRGAFWLKAANFET